MKKFLLLNQDEEPICDLEFNKFSAGILQLGSDYFIVRITTLTDGHGYTVAVYRDVTTAAQAVQELRDFAFGVVKDNQAFAMPPDSEPVTAIEAIDLLT